MALHSQRFGVMTPGRSQYVTMNSSPYSAGHGAALLLVSMSVDMCIIHPC